MGKRPLFILLDGTWAEARKMLGRSPDLGALPVLSLAPDQASRYQLRSSGRGVANRPQILRSPMQQLTPRRNACCHQHLNRK
jgi:hypothetical protein